MNTQPTTYHWVLTLTGTNAATGVAVSTGGYGVIPIGAGASRVEVMQSLHRNVLARAAADGIHLVNVRVLFWSLEPDAL
ncbi:hypothetical protein ABZ694_24805 [Streptomyces albidoflavus]|uniref:hypothetical protein n=1 Tax=Streptomyces albidoflavus TaxID=1886 RepID=UPI0033EB5A54